MFFSQDFTLFFLSFTQNKSNVRKRVCFLRPKLKWPWISSGKLLLFINQAWFSSTAGTAHKKSSDFLRKMAFNILSPQNQIESSYTETESERYQNSHQRFGIRPLSSKMNTNTK